VRSLDVTEVLIALPRERLAAGHVGENRPFGPGEEIARWR
jgi:hypothetical protein